MHPASVDTDDDLDQIVAGVAHDFGNILAVITNYLSLASRRIADPTTAELVDHARAAANRAARLTRQLHELGDGNALEPEPVLVDALVQDASGVLAEVLCDGCTLRLDLAGEPAAAMANRTGLEMALRHLVQNSCDAMPDGGVVTIATRSVVDAGPAKVELSVSDSGAGMAPEVVERASEPRFSTRPKGEAAGLGLTIVDRVMRRLGGEMQIESVMGSGAAVRLLLPGATIGE